MLALLAGGKVRTAQQHFALVELPVLQPEQCVALLAAEALLVEVQGAIATLDAAGERYLEMQSTFEQDAERIVTNTATQPWKKRAWAALWKTTAASCLE